MKRGTKSILGVIAGITILFATTAFIVNDPRADYTSQNIILNDQISLSDITKKHVDRGTFRSSMKITQNNFVSPTKEFYGQKIIISDNPQVDRILIGVTNNLISRIEIWNQNRLIETKELGFMNKMTWGETQTMSIDFYDHTNVKYSGKSKISMRFYDGTGFFGDIGTINFDLTKYGDLSGLKSLGVFAKSLDSNSVIEPEFSDLKIWKNYPSFD
jgi:hypothetical protein